MASLTAKRKEARLQATYRDSDLVSTREYNITLCGAVLWGVFFNYLLCDSVGNVLDFVDPVTFFVGYFVLCIAGVLIAAKSDDAVISFIGYNMVVLPVGLVISTCVELYGGLDSSIVAEAFLITLCITGAMMIMAIAKPEWCETFEYFLLPCLAGLVLAELFMLLLGYSNIATAWIGAIIFSLYIAYDVFRSQEYAKTKNNAVDCAMDIYLDIANLFLRILQILGKSKGGSRR